jgi:predicted NBD/HSP70 family sugar kinase
MVRRLIDSAGASGGAVLRIAIAVQGITDAASRKLLWSPITRYDDIPFADRLEQEFGVPVSVENDCNMIAEALRWRDPVRYRDDFIAILLSHGIGMGLVIKGELFTGTQSSGAEFGHMIHRPDGALCRCGRPRLHRGLCRQLRHLAQRKGWRRECRAAGRPVRRRHQGRGRCGT